MEAITSFAIAANLSWIRDRAESRTRRHRNARLSPCHTIAAQQDRRFSNNNYIRDRDTSDTGIVKETSRAIFGNSRSHVFQVSRSLRNDDEYKRLAFKRRLLLQPRRSVAFFRFWHRSEHHDNSIRVPRPASRSCRSRGSAGERPVRRAHFTIADTYRDPQCTRARTRVYPGCYGREY